MYVFPVPLIPRSRTLRGFAALHSLGVSMPGVSKAWCDSKGGFYDQSTATYGLPYGTGGSCHYTEAVPVAMEPARQVSAPAPTVQTTVPTTITVSPQISPVFTQQFQPTGSPVGASTKMETDTGLTALMERLLAQQQPAPQAPPQMTSQFIPGGPEPEPTPAAAGGGIAPAAPGMFALGAGGNMLPLLIAAGVIGFAVMGKGKAPGRVKRKARR